MTLIGNLLFYRGSILATDPKAELANITAARRAALGQKVYVLDPFNYASDEIAKYRASYNPLSVLKIDSPTIIEDAGLIADAIVIQPPNQKDPHWDESAKNFIEGVILQVATDPQYEGRRTLVTVRELIKTALMEAPESGDDEEPLFALSRKCWKTRRGSSSRKTPPISAGRSRAPRGIFTSEATGSGTACSRPCGGTPSSSITRPCATFLSGDDFDLADLKRDPAGVSIYLCFPATRDRDEPGLAADIHQPAPRCDGAGKNRAPCPGAGVPR